MKYVTVSALKIRRRRKNSPCTVLMVFDINFHHWMTISPSQQRLSQDLIGEEVSVGMFGWSQ